MSRFHNVPVGDRCPRCSIGEKDGVFCVCELAAAAAERVYCPVCGDTPLIEEPCWCVFSGQGVLDENGVLHTAPRLPMIVPADVDKATHVQHVVQIGEESWWCGWHHCDANRCFPPH